MEMGRCSSPKPKLMKEVGDGRAHPVDGDEIDPVEAAQVERAIVVRGREVGLRPVVEVADVVQGHEIAVEGGIGQDGHLRLPVAVV